MKKAEAIQAKATRMARDAEAKRMEVERIKREVSHYVNEACLLNT